VFEELWKWRWTPSPFETNLHRKLAGVLGLCGFVLFFNHLPTATVTQSGEYEGARMLELLLFVAYSILFLRLAFNEKKCSEEDTTDFLCFNAVRGE
jgi:hypothetical protein